MYCIINHQEEIPPPPPPPPSSQTPTQQTPHTVLTIKLPISQKGEYDIWAMKMEHNFGPYRLSNSGRNSLVSNTEGLHKGYDRFQSLLSQLEIHGAGVSTEDANQKFIRSLPSAWSQVSLIMSTKPGVDRPDVELDDSKFTYGPKQTQPSESESQSSEFDTCESNFSAGTPELIVRRQCVSIPTKQQETPSFANKQVKTPRENVKSQFTHIQKPKVDKKGLGMGLLTLMVAPVAYGGSRGYITDEKREGPREEEQVFLDELKRLKRTEKEAKRKLLEDESGLDASKKNCLQFEIQKVWVLVDLPYGKKAIGFLDPKYPQKVYKVVKALYGLHQAPRAWISGVKRFEAINESRFQDEFDESTTFFLDYNQTKKRRNEEASDVEVHSIRSMIGSLMYLTASRPDIMFAVCACSRFQVTPKSSHLSAVKRIFRYLKGKPKLGLWYPRVSSFDLESYSDSDYARANLDRKSTTRGCQFLGRQTYFLQSKSTIFGNFLTTEAEYVAAASCCGQVLWIQNQMLDYGFNFMNTKIYIDNESTICIVKNPVYHSKTKHIAIRHHFIRDAYEKKLIQVLKIHTDDNVADLLTKAFDVSRGLIEVRELLSRVTNGTEALLIPTLFILWWTKLVPPVQSLLNLYKPISIAQFRTHSLSKVHSHLQALISLFTTISLPSTMAVLDSCPKHNMVAYLEKSEGNAEFHEIIDFLKRSSIHHALTVSPVVSTTFVEQFWTSAKSKTINNVRHITAKVAGKSVSISEASIRSDLLFDDADGIDTLPNQAIFDAIQQMGSEAKDNTTLEGLNQSKRSRSKLNCKSNIIEHRFKSISLKQTGMGHIENLKKQRYYRIITEKESATQATQTPTSTIFRDDETIAKVLLNMSQAKAVSREKEKGVLAKDERLIKRMNEKGVDSSKGEVIKEEKKKKSRRE
ncbi:hypothetical protein Tco_1343308 [Tanacetum coccineum]